jgi:hypothetical protein
MEVTAAATATGLNYYVWWFPGSPVRVHLSLDVVRRLAEQLRPGGAETAREGLLFGKAVDGATEVLDFQPAGGRVPEAVAALDKEGAKRLLVGYYRTEAEVLRLNERDLLLARTCFPQAYHVFLIIQPSGFGPASASFFFHDGDGRMAELSLMEFPFEPSLLAGEERDRLRRSQLARTPAAAVVPVREERPRKGRRLLVALTALLLLAALGVAIAFNQRTIREWIQARILVDRPAPAAAAPPPAAPSLAGISIGLHARRENGDVEIAWNRNSPVIAAAQSGVLSIQDGRARREIVLDATQVRTGSIIYAPTSEQISLQLAITTEVNTVIESVILFLPKNGQPAVYPAPAPASAPAAVPLTKPVKPFAPPAATPEASAGRPAPSAEPALPTVGIAVANSSVLPALVGQPSIPPAPPPSASGATGATGAASPAPAASAYHAPEPLRRVVPRFPAESLRAIASPLTVEVRVGIDKSGKVTQADLVPVRGANPLVLERVLTAARQWTFTPARRGSEAVASEFVLQFRIAR